MTLQLPPVRTGGHVRAPSRRKFSQEIMATLAGTVVGAVLTLAEVPLWAWPLALVATIAVVITMLEKRAGHRRERSQPSVP